MVNYADVVAVAGEVRRTPTTITIWNDYERKSSQISVRVGVLSPRSRLWLPCENLENCILILHLSLFLSVGLISWF